MERGDHPIINKSYSHYRNSLKSRKRIRIRLIKKIAISVLFICAIAAASFGVFLYMKSVADSNTEIVAYLDGEKIGFIENDKVLTTALTELTDEIYASTDVVYCFKGKFSYEIVNVTGGVEYIGGEELHKLFMRRCSGDFVKACALYVDGIFVAACKDKARVTSVLDKIELEETDRTRSVSVEAAVISNNTALVEQLCAVSDVIPAEQLYNRLVLKEKTSAPVSINAEKISLSDTQATETAEETYANKIPDTESTGGAEDTNAAIASDIIPAALFAITGGTPAEETTAAETEQITEADTMAEQTTDGKDEKAAGDEGRIIVRSGGVSPDLINYSIDYGIPRSYTSARQDAVSDDVKLTFKYITHETVTGIAERETVYRYYKNFFKGYEALLIEGEDGVEELTYELQYTGDILISRQVVSNKIILEPVDRVVLRGEKDYPEAGVTVDNYVWPMLLCEKPAVTSPYGDIRPEFDGTAYHFGIDIQTDTGTNVYASNGGTVSYVNQTNSCGLMIIIDHDGRVQTCYAHLSEALVELGDKVYQGQNIALSGNTGSSTAPHLHFEVRLDTVPKDPFDYLIEEPWKWE